MTLDKRVNRFLQAHNQYSVQTIETLTYYEVRLNCHNGRDWMGYIACDVDGDAALMAVLTCWERQKRLTP